MKDRALWIWLAAGGLGCVVLLVATFSSGDPAPAAPQVTLPFNEESVRKRAAMPRELPAARRPMDSQEPVDMQPGTGRPLPIRPILKMKTAFQLAQPNPLQQAAAPTVPSPGSPPGQAESGPPPAVEPPPSQPQGTMDPAAIKSAVRAVTPEIRKCYEGGLQMKADSQGTVKVSFTLVASDGGGFMRDAELVESDLGNPVVDSCILGALSNAQFPLPEGGGEVRVTYPFKFNQNQ